MVSSAQHRRILSLLSIASVLCTVALLYLADRLPLFDSSPNVLLPRTNIDHGSSPIAPNTSTLVASFARPLLRWDAIHFVHIAQEGYVYEHEWAFLPGASLVMQGATKVGEITGLLSPGAEHRISHLLVGGALASLNCRTTIVLYDLTLHHFKSPSMAFLTSLLSLLPSSPATLLFTVYNEPFITYFSYRGNIFVSRYEHAFTLARPGMLYCARSQWFLATISFTLAALFRSNGVMLCVYVLWGLFGVPLLQGKVSLNPLG